MNYLNYIASLIILIGVGILYDKHKEKFDLDDDARQYEFIKKYLLQDSTLANSKTPLLWIHMNYSKNSRFWQSFYSRNLKWCRIFGDWILNGWIILNQNKN